MGYSWTTRYIFDTLCNILQRGIFHPGIHRLLLHEQIAYIRSRYDDTKTRRGRKKKHFAMHFLIIFFCCWSISSSVHHIGPSMLLAFISWELNYITTIGRYFVLGLMLIIFALLYFFPGSSCLGKGRKSSEKFILPHGSLDKYFKKHPALFNRVWI